MAAPIDKKPFHPGAAPFGNFINYYSFNPPENRIKLLPNNFLQKISINMHDSRLVALDIGCNCGDLTVEFYNHLKRDEKCTSSQNAVNDLQILGCDMDDTLIQRANESNPYPQNITFINLDVTDEVASNAAFRQYLNKHNRTRFDIISCFSVTMWIHLHGGDTGLEEFLLTISKLTDFLIIEPQPWKCYKSAVKRVKKLKLGNDYFPHFESLKIRDDVVDNIDAYLERKCEMQRLHCFGQTDWNRKLLFYEKRNK
ncbi:pre-miRNA 5'-monophosphate methyltransferase-like [Saccoglossus kowalevskii]|uniref:RNA methyltransferase n=1 Tax=Saccoglossus kowalevskii TaxID=10224 RepID=A0ABM0GPU7_SACKO|nr:PREDICTED: pre-miRNA 5'-monophosphate methyltransferase-like [Saccoglossus kowalevskii]